MITKEIMKLKCKNKRKRNNESSKKANKHTKANTPRTGGSVGEYRAVTWEVVSSTPTGPTLRVLK